MNVFFLDSFLMILIPSPLVMPTENFRLILYLLLNLIIFLYLLMRLKLTMKPNITNLLSLSLGMKVKFILLKELSALIVVQLMNIFPTIMVIKELKLDAKSAKKPFLHKKATHNRLLENALIVDQNYP